MDILRKRKYSRILSISVIPKKWCTNEFCFFSHDFLDWINYGASRSNRKFSRKKGTMTIIIDWLISCCRYSRRGGTIDYRLKEGKEDGSIPSKRRWKWKKMKKWVGVSTFSLSLSMRWISLSDSSSQSRPLSCTRIPKGIYSSQVFTSLPSPILILIILIDQMEFSNTKEMYRIV